MFFNSFDFALFLPIVFVVYWLIGGKRTQIQNSWLLLASYVFYAWWDWRFLSLIIFSSALDYLIGSALEKSNKQRNRKILLTLSIVANIGLLAFFKYFNFFVSELQNAFTLFGTELNVRALNIVLPVGISFYTFQTLSYTIDIYRRKFQPSKNPLEFFAFVSFFPQLVAGPIERASNLLPQFSKPRVFKREAARDGMKQILWGLFKKVVIADNCALYVNEVFSNYEAFNGSSLLLAAVLFAFQIYCDFSGYSDIAIGTARLFGFSLMQNFAFPYFSRNIAEFWRRWHISLSTWFRDYLYIPLGGSKTSTSKALRNIFIIFLVSGFWHGANWTFLAWGFLNAIYFIPSFVLKRNRKYLKDLRSWYFLPKPLDLFRILSTFLLVCIAWIFFRADSITDAFQYIHGIFNSSLFEHPQKYPKLTVILSMIMIAMEWLNRNSKHALELGSYPIFRVFRWTLYVILILSIYFFGNFSSNYEFIYFQF